jgi:predicted DNA-binding transcriptional regulator AlpA
MVRRDRRWESFPNNTEAVIAKTSRKRPKYMRMVDALPEMPQDFSFGSTFSEKTYEEWIENE